MTTEELISRLKVRGSFPDDSYFSTIEYRQILNDSLKSHITPLLLSLNEDYLLFNKEYPIESNNNYIIPSRAVGTKVRDVKIKQNGNYRDLLRLFEEDKSSGRSGYYLKRNSIKLSDDIQSGTLVISFFARPSDLVSQGAYSVISNINQSTKTITVQSLPSGFIVSSKCDFVQAESPYDLLDYDQQITVIDNLNITFNELPSNLQVGDYLCLAKQSPVAQIPEELNQLLIQSSLVQCLSAKKDKAVEYEGQVLQQMKQAFTNMMDPRTESNDSKVRPQGLLRKIRNRY